MAEDPPSESDPLRWIPGLTGEQLDRLEHWEGLFREANKSVNLVSRKDMEAFRLHHLVHSLLVLPWAGFQPRQRILDVGTGGGLPGLPLAICLPHTRFHLCDSIAKKARVVESMRSELGLKNAAVVHKRAETLESRWDFVLGRAVTNLPRFLGWIRGNLRQGQRASLPNGVLYWKGTRYAEELDSVGLSADHVLDLGEATNGHPYFRDKYIIHLGYEQVARADFPEEEPETAVAKKSRKPRGKGARYRRG